MVTILAFLVAFVIGSAYRGAILSFLSVTVEPEPINTFNELLGFKGNIGSMFNIFDDRLRNSEGDLAKLLLKKSANFFKIRNNLDEMLENGDLALGESVTKINYKIRSKFLDRYNINTHV